MVENLDGLSPQNFLRKRKVRHIWSAKRTVHRKKAKPRRRNMIQMAVGICHQLIALLGSGIKTNGLVYSVLHGERHFLPIAVYRTGRSIHQMHDRIMSARLQHIKKSDNIAVYISLRIFYRIANPRLRGKIHHNIRLLLLKNAEKTFLVRNILLVETVCRVLL